MVIGCRSLGYKDDMEKKPSHVEMVTVQATAGMVAGACSSVITTPIDTVKTRLQVYETCVSAVKEKDFGLVWI